MPASSSPPSRPDPAAPASSSSPSPAGPGTPPSEKGSLVFGLAESPFVLSRVARMLRRGQIRPADLLAPHPAGPLPDVTVVIPARNEEATLAAVIRECFHYVAEVIVVEGGSTDRTVEVAEAAGARVVRDNGRGKGAALCTAVEAVRTRFCVFVDADGSHDPIDIPLLVAPLLEGSADQVTGSRMLGGSEELHGGGDEFLRLAGSAFITYLINLRYGVRLSDSQNGFRAIRTDAFRHLRLRSAHTTIEMEMIMAALAAGLRVAEVPTHELPRAAGYSKISLHRPSIWLSYLWALVRGLCRRRRPRTLPVLPA